MRYNNCPRCRNTRRLPIRCDRCNGTGRRHAQCQQCNGRGVHRAANGINAFRCMMCRGSGTVIGPCAKCMGRGVSSTACPCMGLTKPFLVQVPIRRRLRFAFNRSSISEFPIF